MLEWTSQSGAKDDGVVDPGIPLPGIQLSGIHFSRDPGCGSKCNGQSTREELEGRFLTQRSEVAPRWIGPGKVQRLLGGKERLPRATTSFSAPMPDARALRALLGFCEPCRDRKARRLVSGYFP